MADTTTPCCHEAGCKRSQPVLVRREPFSRRWTAITRYKLPSAEKPGLIEALEKHTLDPGTQAELELGSQVLLDLHRFVNDRYTEAVKGSPEEQAYLAVADKLAELAREKETELVGARPKVGA